MLNTCKMITKIIIFFKVSTASNRCKVSTASSRWIYNNEVPDCAGMTVVDTLGCRWYFGMPQLHIFFLPLCSKFTSYEH